MKLSKKILSLFLAFVLCAALFTVSFTANAAMGTTSTATHNRVVGYYPYWNTSAINKIDYATLTHLNLAFMTYQNGRLVQNFSDSALRTIINNCRANDVKVIIALGGGGGFDTSSQPFSTAAKRTAIINELMTFVDNYGIDGVDIDIEVTDSNIWSNFNAFISELSGRLKAENKLLTMAVSSWFTGSISNSTYNYFDFINLMTYDENAGTGPVASMSFVNQQISHYASKGISADRMTIGLPFYGYTKNGGWSGGKAYSEIIADNPQNRFSDYSESFGGIYYNGEDSIRQKTEMSKNYGGVMMWELSQDSFGQYSLMSIIREVMSEGASTLDGNKLSGTATASSIEDNDAQYSADKAIDGNTSTRWSSAYVDPSYITIDLGTASEITGVKLVWEDAYATSYQIRVSDDGTNWRTVYTDSSGNGGTDVIELSDVSARYVQMYGTSRTTIGGTQYGYSLYEFEVYGNKAIAVPATFNSTEYIDKSSEISNNTTYVGNLVNGSYLDYLIDVPTTGNYTISVMAAAGNSNSNRVISAYNGKTLLTTLPVLNSTDWFAYSQLKNGLTLNKGVQTLRLSTNGSVNIENITISYAPDTYQIPCSVNASEFMRSEGVITVNGNNVENFEFDDKTFYIVNVPETGEYKITLNTSATADNAKVHIDTDLSGSFVWVNSIDLPNTGSLSTYQNTEAVINLTAGVQTLKFVVQNPFNFKGFTIERVARPEPDPEPETVDAYVFKIGDNNAYWTTYDYAFTVDVPCQFVDSATYVPFRVIAQAAGAKSVSYNASEGKVTIVNNANMTFELTMFSTACTYTVDGVTYDGTINSAPQFIDGQCCLPIRDVANVTFASVQFVQQGVDGYVLVSANELTADQASQAIDAYINAMA